MDKLQIIQDHGKYTNIDELYIVAADRSGQHMQYFDLTRVCGRTSHHGPARRRLLVQGGHEQLPQHRDERSREHVDGVRGGQQWLLRRAVQDQRV